MYEFAQIQIRWEFVLSAAITPPSWLTLCHMSSGVLATGKQLF